MMQGMTIRADGMDWPLESFIDCYRMVRHDRSYPAIANSDAQINFINEGGQLFERQGANTIHWGSVIAFGVPHFGTDAALCDCCGAVETAVVLNLNEGFCDACRDDCHDDYEEDFDEDEEAG